MLKWPLILVAIPPLAFIAYAAWVAEKPPPERKAPPAPLPEPVIVQSFNYGPGTAIFQRVARDRADAVLIVDIDGGDLLRDHGEYPLKRDISGHEYTHSASSIGCGPGISRYCSCQVGGNSPDKVLVAVAISVSGRESANVEATIEVPWMGRAKRDLPGGAWIEARFERPEK